MVIVPLVGRAATASFLADQAEGTIGDWFRALHLCFFAGCRGGRTDVRLAGRPNRTRSRNGCKYSLLQYIYGACYFASSPSQFLVLRFLACLGVGGMWPNGVALVSEAWPNVSRPILAGLIGTSANLGFMGLSLIAKIPGMEITPDQMAVGDGSGKHTCDLAVLIWLWVPESPKWLAGRVASDDKSASTGNPMTEVFRPPLLRCTILGICLGTIPLMGNWGSANWTVPWAGQVGGLEAPALKASTQLSKSTGGAIGPCWEAGSPVAWEGARPIS